MSHLSCRALVLLLITVFQYAPLAAQTLSIRTTLPRAGKVSLAVYDAEGRQVRTLLAGEAQAAGAHSFAWDGLDRLGKAMPVGSYEWRLLLNDGLEADYLAVVGQTPINAAEPWVWTVGSHQGPSSVVVGASGTIYQGSRNSEGPPVLMKLGSEDGPVLWTRGWQSKGPVDMVELGSHLYVLGWTTKLQRVNAATGQDDGKSIDLLWPGEKAPGCDDAVSSYEVKVGVDGENIVVAYREHNVLRWLEPKTGAVLREVAVPKPKAVVGGENGAVFVLSGAELVSVAADGAIAKILGAGVLTAPVTFDFDRTRREFFVVEGGADQRVRRFPLSQQGQPSQYGRLGGRTDGPYVATDFRDVSHLRCDGAGGFYAVESDHLRRIVHVNAQGAVVKEWLGGTPFFAVTSVDAAAPGELWYNASYTTMAVAKLDLESGKVSITHTYSMPEIGFADGLFPPASDFPVWRVRRHAGGTFLIHESPAAVLRVDATAGKLVPVALASHKRWDARKFKNAAINTAMEKAGLTYDDIGSDAFTWSDANGNGELDADEFRFHNSAALMHGRYCAFDENLNVFIGFQGAKNYCYTGKRWMLFDFKGSAYAKLPNLAAVGTATPVWDWSKLELSRAMLPDDLAGTNVGAVAARHDAHGGVTLAVRGEIGANTDRHGLVWPEDTIGTSCLLRALPDGTAWTVSKQKSPGMNAAAVMRHPGYFPGVAHGCIIASNRNHYGAVAWTEDGLFAGFFIDRHKNDLPDWAYEPAGRGLSGLFAGDDWECAGSLAELADGSVLWIPRASGRAAVFRVRGWDNWFRASGKIALKQATATVPDGAGLAATYFRGKDFAGPPVVSRVDARLWFSSVAGDKRVASWAAGPCEGIAAADPFSVRWTGRIVAPFSEDFWFRIYNQTADASFIQAQWWKAGGGSARVWLNDVLIADDARFESAPVRLLAGHSYDVKVEYASPGIAKPEFALSWASNTKEWQRVPTANLHADAAPIGPTVRVTAEKSSVLFTLAAKQPKPLTVRFRHTGTDAVTTAAQVIIPAGKLTASAVVSVQNGPCKIELEPSADYRGDGTAGAVTVGSVPSITDGLAAAYLFDEAQGRTIHDSMGGASAAFEVFMNPPVPRWLPTGGIRAGAMEFAEPGLRVNLPGAKIAGDFTVAFWLRTKQPTQPIMVGAFDLMLKDGHPRLDFGGWGTTSSKAPRLDDGEWHHVAFVWNQSGGKRAMHLFIDGTEAATGNGPEKGHTERLSLGVSNQLQGKPFLGTFDELRIYQRPLTVEELTALAEKKSPAKTHQ